MSELVNRAAVSIVALEVAQLGLLLREQFVSDQGIDAHVEDAEVVGTEPVGNGRLLAVQIKGGDSQFRSPTSDGWWFRFSARHASLWLNHVLPVVVVLVDTTSGLAYWQEVSPATVRPAGRRYKVEVPRSQSISSARDAWRELASGLTKRAPYHWEHSLERLPPAVSRLLLDLPADDRHDAALLAFHLAEGRNNASGTLASLLTVSPIWLQRNASWGWKAVSIYAASHGLPRLAVAAFQKTALADPIERGRWLASAALQALDYDRDLASALVDQSAADGGPEHVLEVLRAVLVHPEGEGGAIALPPQGVLTTAAAQQSAVVQSFLAVQAQRRGDLPLAIRYSETVLAIDPTDSYAMCHRAELLTWATVFHCADSSSVSEAVQLLRSALDQRLRWSGPTHKVAMELARACLIVGDHRQILEVCVEPPVGIAASEVANAPEARRLAVLAAALLRRESLLKSLLARLGGEPADDLVRWQIGITQFDEAEVARLYRLDLDSALSGDNPERAAVTCLDLARLGVDATGMLEPFIERSIITEGTLQLARALVLAHKDLDSALPDLRELARSDKKAAEMLVALLTESGRLREAVGACEDVLLQGDDELFKLRHAELVLELGDPSAPALVAEVAARLTGFPTERARLLKILAQSAADRDDWGRAEELMCEAARVLVEPDANTVWMLVAAQLNLGRLDRCASTIDRYDPAVRSLKEAELWLRATTAAVWDAKRASQAIALAAQFNHPKLSTALLTRVVTATRGSALEMDGDDETDAGLDQRSGLALQAVPGELHRQAFDALGQLVKKYGDETGILILKGDSEDLFEQIVELLKQGEERTRALSDLYKQAREAQVPIGFAAAAAGKGYATLLVERAVGPLVTASADDSEYVGEFDAAAASLGGPVAADGSAILTASNAAEWRLLGRFSAVNLTSATLLDFHRADTDVRASAMSPGTMGLDSSSGGLWLIELGNEEFARRLNRVGIALKAASRLPVHNIEKLELLAALGPRPEHKCWVDSIELAHQLGVSLWADDLGLRRLARSLGVRAFGTAALIDAMRAESLARGSVQDAEGILDSTSAAFRALARDQLVDLPLSPGDALLLARQDHLKPMSGAVAISRPSWWVWQSTALRQLTEIYAEAAVDQPDQLRAWQRAAMLGAARAVTAEHAPGVLAALAIHGFGSPLDVPVTVDGLRNARSVAQMLEVGDPVPEVPAALVELTRAKVLPDADRFVADVLAQLTDDAAQK